MKTSKIATIIYKNYEENVDMLNAAFSQKELDNLVATDKDIIRVDYYINGVLVGNKMFTPKQAIAQFIKMEVTQAKMYDMYKAEGGPDWVKNRQHNERLDSKRNELINKQDFYRKFIDKKSFEESELPCMMCCEWVDFKHEIYN